MALIFHTPGGQIIARGDTLGILKRILLWVRFPLPVKSAMTDESYIIVQVGAVQEMTDDELSRLRAEARAKAIAQQQQMNQKNGPKRTIPGGKR